MSSAAAAPAAPAAASEHVIVTGGCGFFGAWIVKQLLDDGVSVTVYDMRHDVSKWEMTMSAAEIARVAFTKVSVSEPEFVAQLVKDRPTAVIHLAGLQVPTCRANPIAGASVNVIGTLNVFEAAKKLKAEGAPVPRIVYARFVALFFVLPAWGAPGEQQMPLAAMLRRGGFLSCASTEKRRALSIDEVGEAMVLDGAASTTFLGDKDAANTCIEENKQLADGDT